MSSSSSSSSSSCSDTQAFRVFSVLRKNAPTEKIALDRKDPVTLTLPARGTVEIPAKVYGLASAMVSDGVNVCGQNRVQILTRACDYFGLNPDTAIEKPQSGKAGARKLTEPRVRRVETVLSSFPETWNSLDKSKKVSVLNPHGMPVEHFQSVYSVAHRIHADGLEICAMSREEINRYAQKVMTDGYTATPDSTSSPAPSAYMTLARIERINNMVANEPAFAEKIASSEKVSVPRKNGGEPAEFSVHVVELVRAIKDSVGDPRTVSVAQVIAAACYFFDVPCPEHLAPVTLSRKYSTAPAKVKASVEVPARAPAPTPAPAAPAAPKAEKTRAKDPEPAADPKEAEALSREFTPILSIWTLLCSCVQLADLDTSPGSADRKATLVRALSHYDKAMV